MASCVQKQHNINLFGIKTVQYGEYDAMILPALSGHWKIIGWIRLGNLMEKGFISVDIFPG